MNDSGMQTMYSTTFGNGNFKITAPKKGELSKEFPTIPYVSIEAIFYQQMTSNPLLATQNVLSGSTAGNQNISGTQTVTDSTGNTRVQIGYGKY